MRNVVRHHRLVCSLAMAMALAACQKTGEPANETENESAAAVAVPDQPLDPATFKRAEAAAPILEKVNLPTVPPAFQLTPAEMVVSDTLSYRKKVEAHAAILEKLQTALGDAQARKNVAKNKNDDPAMFKQYLSAEEDEKNTLRYLAPYAIAQGQSETLQKEGYLLRGVGASENWTGEACKGDQCASIDPITALIMIITGGLVDELNKEQPFGPNNDFVKVVSGLVSFINRPLGGPNSDLVKIRNAMLFNDKNGEITRLIKDPIKRPIEIVQNWRDAVISPTSSNELAKAARDPIKCTIGHLWGGCDQ